MRPISELIIHCSATPEGKNFTARDIDRWHKQRGWRGIGYHYVVLLDGTIQEGRPLRQIGAHVRGHNRGTIGICYIGGVAKDGRTAKDTRTPAQKRALLEICKRLTRKFPSIQKVTGHNQYAAKACPSFDVRKDPLGSLV
ncbi:N-acetylmuramoyl-L-alanine amidase [Parasphingorhabdus sp.]|uniref:N-acetylmuramoyl-L-alanine amidase n=1 Tax=Parasphingorhabdus sp. TaxID=2709688 RepID=UPI003A92F2A0